MWHSYIALVWSMRHYLLVICDKVSSYGKIRFYGNCFPHFTSFNNPSSSLQSLKNLSFGCVIYSVGIAILVKKNYLKKALRWHLYLSSSVWAVAKKPLFSMTELGRKSIAMKDANDFVVCFAFFATGSMFGSVKHPSLIFSLVIKFFSPFPSTLKNYKKMLPSFSHHLLCVLYSYNIYKRPSMSNRCFTSSRASESR